jgi:hypothetical protein
LRSFTLSKAEYIVDEICNKFQKSIIKIKDVGISIITEIFLETVLEVPVKTLIPPHIPNIPINEILGKLITKYLMWEYHGRVVSLFKTMLYAGAEVLIELGIQIPIIKEIISKSITKILQRVIP